MLIGVTGKAGSGKDQSFHYIKEWAESEGRPVRRDAFADRLKISAGRALGIPQENCIDFCNKLKRPGNYVSYSVDGGEYTYRISGREYLQHYGTEAHREVFGYDFWISAVISQYDSEEILVITDVRFENEAEAVRAAGGEIWHILRPRDVEIEDTHISEQPIRAALVDYTIYNDSSLDHLRDLVVSRIERKVYA